MIDIFVNPNNYGESILVREVSKWKILSIYLIGLLSIVQMAVVIFRLM